MIERHAWDTSIGSSLSPHICHAETDLECDCCLMTSLVGQLFPCCTAVGNKRVCWVLMHTLYWMMLSCIESHSQTDIWNWVWHVIIGIWFQDLVSTTPNWYGTECCIWTGTVNCTVIIYVLSHMTMWVIFKGCPPYLQMSVTGQDLPVSGFIYILQKARPIGEQPRKRIQVVNHSLYLSS